MTAAPAPLSLADIGELDESLQHGLRESRFADVDFEAFVENTQLGPRRIAEHRPVIAGRPTVPPGFVHTPCGLQREDAESLEPPHGADLRHLLDRCHDFFSPLASHGLAVQCSGGLDSSIIAAILRMLEIPFALIGLCTSRYEFRTERVVQDSLAPLATCHVLIDHESVLPMSALDAVRPHAFPSLSSLTHAAEQAMADACRRAGVGIMVSGSGGDVLMADPPPNRLGEWPLMIFGDWWLDRYVYRSTGVRMAYPFADPDIAGAFWSLRESEPDDPKKRWARNFFRDCLPSVLTDYTYKADHWGVHTAGLLRNMWHATQLHDRAYARCGRDFFESDRLRSLLAQDVHAQNQSLHLQIEARMALATWVCSVMDGSHPTNRSHEDVD